MTIDDLDNQGHIRHLDRRTATSIETGDRRGVIVSVDNVNRGRLRIFLVGPHSTTGAPIVKAHNDLSLAKARQLRAILDDHIAATERRLFPRARSVS